MIEKILLDVEGDLLLKAGEIESLEQACQFLGH